jgi:hypothetical protein
MSVLGGASTGTRGAGALLGYVRGRRGCYCIPGDASPPAVPPRRTADDSQWTAVAVTS